jgi:hypothetical protein
MKSSVISSICARAWRLLGRILQEETEEKERGIEKGGRESHQKFCNSENSEILFKTCNESGIAWRSVSFSRKENSLRPPWGANEFFWGDAFPGCVVAPFAISVSPDGAKTEEVANPYRNWTLVRKFPDARAD